MSDYPMLISNKLHSFRNFSVQTYIKMYDYGATFFLFSTFVHNLYFK